MGVDIRRDEQLDAAFELRIANLAVEPIPYESGMFGSVSAFDFIEHVPRVLRSVSDHRATVFPFIELMNEIWRVLAPGGRLYALTPCYPAGEIFQDPTHVNFITDQTHNYFAGDYPWGRMYGYKGLFRLIRAERVCWRDGFEPMVPLTTKQRWRHFRYSLQGRLTHIVWEFECRKPSTGSLHGSEA